jgi:hypothetical protein
MDTKLNDKWILWFHREKDNWESLTSYEKIYEIDTIESYWRFHNNWDKVGGIINKHFFLMKNKVTPIWEDKQNCDGGCWSFKVEHDLAEELWEDLSVYLLCGQLCPTITDEIVGLSACLKKNNSVVIKIWNTNSSNNSLKLINENILKKWGTEIIYIAHIVTY